MPRERRWIILAEDGRHVTVGRCSDPTEEELVRASNRLRGLGLGGWLAVTEGQYYGRGQLALMMVRELAATATLWESAVEKFRALRAEANDPGPSP
jgi:hypothetical protein